MFPLLLSSLLLGVDPAAPQGGLDTEINKPYLLEVVLGFGEHPWLKGDFQDRVEREVRDGLRADLGNLARVEVKRKHDQLRDVMTRGLQHAFDSWKDVSNKKTHFVLIDYRGEYSVQARQYDGYTGLASPVVRMRREPERLLVASVAARMVAQDFGVVGTVVNQQGDKVDLAIKGVELLEAGSPWIKKDDVFAVAQILSQGGAGARSERRPWTLLQVLEPPKNGICPCMIYHRFLNPLTGDGGSLGFRCLKLGTTEARVRLRIVDDKGLPRGSKTVKFGRTGFDDEHAEARNTDPNGLAVTKSAYRNIAFVKVLEGSEGLAQVPIEVLDDRTIVCNINSEPGAEEKSHMRDRWRRWSGRISDSVESSTSLFNALNTLGKQSASDALARAKSGLGTLNKDLANIRDEREALRKESASTEHGNKPDFDEADQLIEELQKRHDRIQGFITETEKILADEKDPKKQQLQQLVTNAKLRADQYDFDGAIELYERAFREGYENPALKKQVDELKEAWRTKSEDHAKARYFIYNTWPDQLNAKNIKAKLQEAKKAFQTCKAIGDYLTPRKLVKVYIAHASALDKEASSLKLEYDDDRDTADTIKRLTPELKKLNDEVIEYLKEKK